LAPHFLCYIGKDAKKKFTLSVLSGLVSSEDRVLLELWESLYVVRDLEKAYTGMRLFLKPKSTLPKKVNGDLGFCSN